MNENRFMFLRKWYTRRKKSREEIKTRIIVWNCVKSGENLSIGLILDLAYMLNEEWTIKTWPRERECREREIIIIIEWNCVNDSILLLVLNSSPKLLTTVSSRSFFSNKKGNNYEEEGWFEVSYVSLYKIWNVFRYAFVFRFFVHIFSLGPCQYHTTKK